MFKKIILPLILILLLSPTFSFAAKELDADNDGKIDSTLLPIDTSTSLGPSDTKVPSQNATKTYADTKAPINAPTFTGTVKGIISGTVDNCVKIGADGSIVDAGDVCGSGSVTGDIVQSGSPANHYWAYFTADKTLTGVAITASKPVCSDANGNPAVCAGTEGVWQVAGSYIASTALDDTKGNGDTAYFWSADKSYDQLALKLGTTDKAADADKLDNHDSTYFQVDLGFVKGTMTDGKYCTYTESGTVLNCDSDAGSLAPGTAYQVYHTNSGATAGEWTSTLGATGTRLTKGWFTNLEVTNDITIGGNALATIYQPLDSTLTGLAGINITVDGSNVTFPGTVTTTAADGSRKVTLQANTVGVDATSDAFEMYADSDDLVKLNQHGTEYTFALNGLATGGLILGDSSPDAAGEIGYDGELKYYDTVGSKTVQTVKAEKLAVFNFDGAAADNTVVDAYVPVASTITGVLITTTGAACSAVVDIWGDTYANFPATNDDTITDSAPPTLSTAQKNKDTTLTGWTTAIAADTVLRANLDSSDCSGLIQVTVFGTK